MHKIHAKSPFELVAVDLLQLPGSRGITTLLVTIDHFSKWGTVVPIKDKRGRTVATAFEERVLPNLVGIPGSVLSDNGPEFRSSDFREMLSSYNINHIYTTPSKASSNGCVERLNRTLIQMLRGLIDGNPGSWLGKLPKAMIIYNNTKHTETGKSPSDILLTDQHDPNNKIPVKEHTALTWKTGNPKFSPYEVGQKVLRKIIKQGNLLSNKLTPKYEGPYEVISANPNKVTYEIQHCGNPRLTRKVHYEQLRPFKEIPRYLSSWMGENDTREQDAEEGSSAEDSAEVGVAGIRRPDTSEDSASDEPQLGVVALARTPRRREHSKINKVVRPINESSGEFQAKVRQLSARLQSLRSSTSSRLTPSTPTTNSPTSVATPVALDLRLSRDSESQLETEVPSTGLTGTPGLLEATGASLSWDELPFQQVGEMRADPLETAANHTGTRSRDESADNEEIEEGDDNDVREAREYSGDTADEPLHATVFSTPLGEDVYEGFGAADAGRKVGSAKLTAIRLLRRHSSYYYDNEFEYEKGNNYFLRKIWNRNYLNSANTVHNRSLSEDDSPRNTTPVGRLDFAEATTSTPNHRQIHTRSRGKARELDHVQPTTLEYKIRAMQKRILPGETTQPEDPNAR